MVIFKQCISGTKVAEKKTGCIIRRLQNKLAVLISSNLAIYLTLSKWNVLYYDLFVVFSLSLSSLFLSFL